MVTSLSSRETSLFPVGWDEESWGAPVSQVELVRTWLDFTLVSYRALETMGYDFTDEELAAVYRRWQHQGRLLGIDETFYAEITTHEQAARLADLIALTDEGPDPDTKPFLDALQDAAVQQLTPVFGDEDLTGSLVRAFARLIQGEERADLLVAGCYGHSRLGEWMFGGMTRELLATSPVCCLMSH